MQMHFVNIGKRPQAGACPRPLLTGVMALLLIGGCGGGPVDVPSDAPLQRADCRWPESTELAFAGWSTPAKLKFADMKEVPGTPGQVFALVTLDELPPSSGAGEPTRRFCARSIDGKIQQGAAAATWRPPADPAP